MGRIDTVDRNAPGHINVLDGLRGLAILMVLITHSFVTAYTPSVNLGPFGIGLEPLVLGGSLGVELFFFISGFVLFIPYARANIAGTAPPSLRRFADRRFIKIVPSYLVALFLQFFFFTQPPDDRKHAAFQLLSHLTFTHTFWFETIFSINGAFWSLAPEVQFYFLFPLIAAAMRKNPYLTYGAALAIGEGYRIWLHATELNQNFFFVCQLPAQIDLFVLGMLCAYLYVRYGDALRRPRISYWATGLALAALAFGIWLLSDFSHVTKTMEQQHHQSWQSDHRLIVSWTIAVVALGSIFSVPIWRRIVANPVLTWFSVISYNLYLWHEPIVAQCQKTGFPCALTSTPWTTVRFWSEQFFYTYVVISIALAIFFTYAFERPLLRLGTGGLYAAALRLVRRTRD